MSLTSMPRFVSLIVAALAGGAALPASAQSFNIDLDHVFGPVTNATGAPTKSFPGAAGQLGFWNAMPSHQTTPFALKDLASLPTTASLTAFTASSSGLSLWSFNANPNTGDFARLMNDVQIVHNTPATLQYTFTFNGLQNGAYQVYTYGARPMIGLSATRVSVSGGGPAQIITGPMTPNVFTPLLTHSVHTTLVTAGTLTVTVDAQPGMNAQAFVGGFQLVQVPAPGALGLMGAVGVGAALRRRR